MGPAHFRNPLHYGGAERAVLYFVLRLGRVTLHNALIAGQHAQRRAAPIMIFVCAARTRVGMDGWMDGWMGEPRGSNDDDDDLMVWWRF